VDADADEVAGLDGFGDDLLDGLVDEDGVACGRRGGCCEHEEPSGGDNCGTEGVVTGIDEVNADESTLFLAGTRWIQRERLSRMCVNCCGLA
jgi:hypothetical protein